MSQGNAENSERIGIKMAIIQRLCEADLSVRQLNRMESFLNNLTGGAVQGSDSENEKTYEKLYACVHATSDDLRYCDDCDRKVCGSCQRSQWINGGSRSSGYKILCPKCYTPEPDSGIRGGGGGYDSD